MMNPPAWIRFDSYTGLDSTSGASFCVVVPSSHGIAEEMLSHVRRKTTS
ncbi:DUF2138 family protein [Shigella flexneri]